MAHDPICEFFTRVSGADDLKKTLDPDKLLKTACRVIKHPDCCVLCAANNDCARIPLHYNCRCKPEGYLELAP